MAADLNPLVPSPWEVVLVLAGSGLLTAGVAVAVVLVAVRRTSRDAETTDAGR